MNTIKLKLFLLTAFAMLITGCAVPEQNEFTKLAYHAYDIPPINLPTINLLAEEVKVNQDLGRRVFVNVVESPRLTAGLQRALTRSGFLVAQSRDKADVVYEIEGIYTAQNPNQPPRQIALGVYAERSDGLVQQLGRVGQMIPSQKADVTLTRMEGGRVNVTKAEVQLDKNNSMTPTFMFQSALDALVQSTGLPRNSLRVSEKSAGI